ncbi:MAG: histidine phosphatase family protein [Lysobacteraceae bacterium]
MTLLYLLRHAHAETAASGQSDAERSLSEHGQAEADAAGQHFIALPRPERVLCSPARRARETAERVLAVLGYIDTRHEPRIYEATPGDLIDVLDENAEAGSVLLVGHNPGLERLVALLSTGQSGLNRGMSPASLATLELPDGVSIEPGCARLTAFWSP